MSPKIPRALRTTNCDQTFQSFRSISNEYIDILIEPVRAHLDESDRLRASRPKLQIPHSAKVHSTNPLSPSYRTIDGRVLVTSSVLIIIIPLFEV